MNIKNILSSNAHWQVNKHLSKIFGDLRASVLLSDLIDSYIFFDEKSQLIEYNNNMYFFQTSDKMQERTMLSYKEQKTCISILEKHEVIKTKVMGVPAKLHFTISENKIWSLLNSSIDEKSKLELTKGQNILYKELNNKELNNKEYIPQNSENHFLKEKKENEFMNSSASYILNNEVIDESIPEAENKEKKIPPHSAAPPLKKENDLNALESIKPIDRIQSNKKRNKMSVSEEKLSNLGFYDKIKYGNGYYYSKSVKGEDVKWYGHDLENPNIGLTKKQEENIKKNEFYSEKVFQRAIRDYSLWLESGSKAALNTKSDYLTLLKWPLRDAYVKIMQEENLQNRNALSKPKENLQEYFMKEMLKASLENNNYE